MAAFRRGGWLLTRPGWVAIGTSASRHGANACSWRFADDTFVHLRGLERESTAPGILLPRSLWSTKIRPWH
jgi:hypothetical protein